MKLNGFTGTVVSRQGMLYENGKTEYRILLPAEPTVSECFAASELTRILQKAGVSMETVREGEAAAGGKFIALGKTSLFAALGIHMTTAEYKFDGYLIETTADAHIICGVGDTGTCFGVYGFAEYAMGYRYYARDEWKVSCRAEDREFHIKDVPAFMGRNCYSYLPATDADHGFRLRLNGDVVKRFPRHGEATPWSSLNDQSYALQIMDYMVYRKDHPDWYYLPEGWEELPPPRCYPQLCLAKAMLPDKEGGFFDTFMKNLIEGYIIPEQDKIFFMLGLSDHKTVCQCPACRKAAEKYTVSGQAMRFTNMVADAVKVWRREHAPERQIYLVTFAYQATFDPPVVEKNGAYLPVDESVIARDNVIVRNAPIWADYVYPLLDETHNPASRASLLGWKAVAKNMAIWDYRQDFHSQTFPYPMYTTPKNIRSYLELGVMDVFYQAQAFCEGSPFIEMDDFALSRLSWNSGEDYDELTAEFRRAYYDAAEPFVTEYLHELRSFHLVLKERGWTGKCHERAAHRGDLYTPEDPYRFKAILDKALAAVRTIADPARRAVIHKRVETLTLYWKGLVINVFPHTLSRDDALELTADVRRICRDCGLSCWAHWKATEDYLRDVEDLILGNVTPETRKYPLWDLVKKRKLDKEQKQQT